MANVGAHVISNAGGPDCIFERLGGQSPLEKFVDGFYDLMATDKDTKKFFENRNLKNLKKRTVDYLGGLWGGPAYRGPDLFLAHTGLGVTVRIFEVMMKCAEKQLKLMKVKSGLSKEILDDLRSMKEPLCDPTGRLAKERHAKNLAMGDPFDDAANRAAYAAKQQEEQERRKKIAEFRKKKQEEREAKERAEKAKKEKAAQSTQDSKMPKKTSNKEAKIGGKEAEDEKKLKKPKAPEEAVEAPAEEASQSVPSVVEELIDSEYNSDSSDDSAMNAHLVLLQDKKKLEAPKSKLEAGACSGDSGLLSLQTTMDGALNSAISEGRAATISDSAALDAWSSIPQDFAAEPLPTASYCDLMDWRVSTPKMPKEEVMLSATPEGFVDQPKQSLSPSLLIQL